MNAIYKWLFIFQIITIFHASECFDTNPALWESLISSAQNWSREFVSEQKPFIKEIVVSSGVSPECNASIWHTLESILNLDDWSIRMLNSWGRFPPSGLLIGTVSDFGSYDQCLSIGPNPHIGQSQYCTVDLSPPLPTPMPVHHNLFHQIRVLPDYYYDNHTNSDNVFVKFSNQASFFYLISIRTGICTPSKCSTSDISLMANQLALRYGLEFKSVYCQTNAVITMNSVQIFSILLISLFVILSLFATFTENYWKVKSRKIKMFEKTFSLTQNIGTLFGNCSTDELLCVHGLRVLTMIWIIFCHSIEWINLQLYSRTFRVKDIFTSIASQPLLNGEYTVETFFFISGMLTSLMTLKHTKQKLSKFNLITFLLSRYLRLTPQIFVFIFVTFLLPLLTSGQLWRQTITPVVNNCYNNWWRNLLYIQNMFKTDEMCALHSWYLACDMQFHWLSIFIVIPLLYKIQIGITMAFVSIIGFYVTSTIFSFVNDLPPGLINTARDHHFLDYYIELFYVKPWSHGSVFFIGFAFGILLYQKRFVQLNNVQRFGAKLLILIGYAACLMDTYYWVRGAKHDRLVSAFVFSTCRLLWSLSTASLVWLCVSGNAGLINTILSSKIFVPLSRLTYSVYLSHVWIIWLYIGSRRETIDSSQLNIVFLFAHNLLIAYLIGFLFAIVFEMPIIKLQKRLINTIITEKIETEENRELNVKIINDK